MRQLVIAAAALALVSAGCGTSAPTTTGSAGSCSLMVSITATGSTVWGTVVVKDGSHKATVTSASQKVALPCNSEATLTQTPADSSTWPFNGWQVAGTTSHAATLHLRVKGTTKVTATYILGSSSNSGTQSTPPPAAASSPSSSSSSSSSGSSGW